MTHLFEELGNCKENFAKTDLSRKGKRFTLFEKIFSLFEKIEWIRSVGYLSNNKIRGVPSYW